MPLPNIFLTHLFSKLRLKRKDFPEVARLPWAQEVRGSNPRAPTKSLQLSELEEVDFGGGALWCNLGTIKKNPKVKRPANVP